MVYLFVKQKPNNMIRSFTKALALLVLVSATFIACKKDKDDETNQAVTKENLLGTYLRTSLKYKAVTPSGTAEEELMDTWEACEKDDFTILKSDGKIEYKDAGTACDPSTNGVGLWSLTDNKITIDGSEYTVITLTNKKLVGERVEEFQGMTFTHTVTYERK